MLTHKFMRKILWWIPKIQHLEKHISTILVSVKVPLNLTKTIPNEKQML